MTSSLLPRSMLAALLLAAAIPPAAADDDVFRIGIVTRGSGSARVEGLARIEAEFGRAISRPVQVFVAESYGRLIEAHLSGRIDYAVYSTPAFAAAQLRCGCLRPIAAPVASDGSVGIRSVLVGGAGLRLAIGADDSLATRLVPLLASPEAKAAQSGGMLVSAASTSEARALYEQRAVEGYFGWRPAWPSDAPPDASGAWRSGVIPYGPHAVRAELGEDIAAALLSLLASGGEGEETAGALLDPRASGRFITVTEDDYALAIEAVALLRDRKPDGD